MVWDSGGNVEIMNSVLGNGGIFGLKLTDLLPFKRAAKVKRVPEKARLLESKSILIVDDSIDNLEIIKLFLNSFGGKTDIAHNGNEALKKMQSTKYDVILMDIEMPQMNGFQVIKELRKLKIATPVLALTAHAMPEDRLNTSNAGFFDHVTKPIDFNYLVNVIRKLKN